MARILRIAVVVAMLGLVLTLALADRRGGRGKGGLWIAVVRPAGDLLHRPGRGDRGAPHRPDRRADARSRDRGDPDRGDAMSSRIAILAAFLAVAVAIAIAARPHDP